MRKIAADGRKRAFLRIDVRWVEPWQEHISERVLERKTGYKTQINEKN